MELRDHPSVKDYHARKVTGCFGPYFIQISSSGRCNLSCFMCTFSMSDEIPIDIDLNNLEPFLEKASRLCLASGEPLWLSKKANPVTHDLFKDVISNHSQIKFNVFSNGTMNIDREMAKTIMDRFTDVNFSLDTIDPHLYEKIRGKPLLGKLLSNIRMLSEMKQAAGLGRLDPPHINLSTVVMESTFDGIPEIAKFAVDNGILIHYLLRLSVRLPVQYVDALQSAYSRNGDNESSAVETIADFTTNILEEICTIDTASPDRLEKVRRKTGEIYNGTGVILYDQVPILVNKHDTGGEKPLPKKDDKICSEPWTRMHILSDGDVLACCANSMVLGNINTNSFDEIWNGKAAQELRQSFLRGEMKGCAKHICPATANYFSNDHIHNLQEKLEKSFNGDQIRSILLLRTAPIQKSGIVARTIQQAFPDVKLSVATNSAGKFGLKRMVPDAEILVYPGDSFEHEKTVDWLQNQGRRYDLAAAVYDMKSSVPYSNIDSILGDIAANTKIKITYDGDILKV
jgi:MoaA/NifB/PqqE/SkfB family radical SAM enzyme